MRIARVDWSIEISQTNTVKINTKFFKDVQRAEKFKQEAEKAARVLDLDYMIKMRVTEIEVEG